MYTKKNDFRDALNNLYLFVRTLPFNHPFRVTEEFKNHNMAQYSKEAVFERLTLALKVYDDDEKKKDDGIYNQLAFYQKVFKELIDQPEPMDQSC